MAADVRVVCVTLLLTCTQIWPVATKIVISGNGASFPNKVYQEWISKYT